MSESTPPRRPPGRPPIDRTDRPSVEVHVSLPATVYDRAYQLARAHRITIPELLRRGLRGTLATKA